MKTPMVPELIIPKLGHFQFVRAIESAIFGEGNWITVQQYRSLPPNTILPLDFQNELSILARARGIPEMNNYARRLPKPERKSVSVGRPKSEKSDNKDRKKSTLQISFNPFA